jgi:hypothetical protein
VTSLIIGFLIDGLGFLAAFIFLTICYVVVLFYVIVLLPESLSEANKKSFSLSSVAKSLVSSFKVLFHKRENDNDLLAIQLIFISMPIVAVVATGSISLLTVYAVAPPFCFDAVSVGSLTAITSSMVVFVGPLEVKAWSYFFSDEFAICMCLLVALFAYILTGLANTSTALYVGKLVGFFL